METGRFVKENVETFLKRNENGDCYRYIRKHTVVIHSVAVVPLDHFNMDDMCLSEEEERNWSSLENGLMYSFQQNRTYERKGRCTLIGNLISLHLKETAIETETVTSTWRGFGYDTDNVYNWYRGSGRGDDGIGVDDEGDNSDATGCDGAEEEESDYGGSEVDSDGGDNSDGTSCDDGGEEESDYGSSEEDGDGGDNSDGTSCDDAEEEESDYGGSEVDSDGGGDNSDGTSCDDAEGEGDYGGSEVDSVGGENSDGTSCDDAEEESDYGGSEVDSDDGDNSDGTGCDDGGEIEGDCGRSEEYCDGDVDDGNDDVYSLDEDTDNNDNGIYDWNEFDFGTENWSNWNDSGGGVDDDEGEATSDSYVSDAYTDGTDTEYSDDDGDDDDYTGNTDDGYDDADAAVAAAAAADDDDDYNFGDEKDEKESCFCVLCILDRMDINGAAAHSGVNIKLDERGEVREVINNIEADCATYEEDINPYIGLCCFP